MTLDISQLFDFSDYGALVVLLSNSILAGAVLGIVGGVVGYFVMARDLAFAVHGISELSFAGASAALLIGADVLVGSMVGSILAALLIGVLGVRARDRNSIIGVLMPFGLGLGILFLALYPGRASNKFGLLTGQIVAVDSPELGSLIAVSVVVLVAIAILWRPLLFASVDEEVARARGLPVRSALDRIHAGPGPGNVRSASTSSARCSCSRCSSPRPRPRCGSHRRRSPSPA